METQFPAIVVMGVAGSGKTTIGEALALRVGAAFVEGDRLHPTANVDKMAAGTPLSDDDRWPWLDAVGEEIARLRMQGPVVAACSALKRAYRDRLRTRAGTLLFVFPDGPRDLLAGRLQARRGHFFPASLLDDQLATLEPPGEGEDFVRVEFTKRTETVVAAVVEALGDAGDNRIADDPAGHSTIKVDISEP